MIIDIVTHCWAVQYPHFAEALRIQIASLCKSTPKQHQVRLIVLCERNDWLTRNTLKNCDMSYPINKHHNLKALCFIFRNANALGRRSIGRNIVARETAGDIVWFTDVDHYFGEGCLDDLANLKWPEGASMIYPRNIMIHKDHATGDDFLKSNTDHINVADFVPKSYNRAIGGVQIVQGDFARKYGYLDGIERWQTPAEKPFGDFRDDIAYRKFCLSHGPIVGVELRNLFRIRHSQTTYQ